MDPKASQVRSLTRTQQEWYPDSDGNQVYNTPLQTGQLLDGQQGKDPRHLGTCGIVSCVNVLRLAGRTETTEAELLSFSLNRCLCTYHPFLPQYSGGTNPNTRQLILQRFGLESEILPPAIDTIAEAVSAGKGVILSVYAAMFWKDARYGNMLHAVTVTSVVKDAAGSVTGFYLCDSGRENCRAYYCTAQELAQSLSGKPMNVTTTIIR